MARTCWNKCKYGRMYIYYSKVTEKLTLYFMSWHLTPTTAWCPTKLLHPNTVWPGRSSPTTAPLIDKVTHVITERLNSIKNASQKYINFQTHVIKMQCSPNVVFPNTWLPGYSRQPFPSFAEDPTVQKGPIETPWTDHQLQTIMQVKPIRLITLISKATKLYLILHT